MAHHPGQLYQPPTVKQPPTPNCCRGPYISKVFNYRWFITKLSLANWALPLSLSTPLSRCVAGTFTSLWESSFILKWVLPVNLHHTFWTQHVSCVSSSSHLVRGGPGIHQLLYCGRVNAHLILLWFPVKIKEKRDARRIYHDSTVSLRRQSPRDHLTSCTVLNL